MMLSFSVAYIYAKRSTEDDRWGGKQLPTLLGYNAALRGDELTLEVYTIIRAFRAGWRSVTLMNNKNDMRHVVAYVDVATPGRWGDGVFKVRE